MTDYATFKQLPAQERDELGFAKWRENEHIGTHGPGCWKYGRNHYECARAEIEQLMLERDVWAKQAIDRRSDAERLLAQRDAALADAKWLRGVPAVTKERTTP